MKIEDIQKEKKKLEDEISKKLNEFQKKYSLFISDLDLITNAYRTNNGLYIEEPQVTIEVKV